MATRIGLEPTTPSVTGWCSNQLSYRAMIAQVRAASYRGNVLYYIEKSACCQAQICRKCNFLQKRGGTNYLSQSLSTLPAPSGRVHAARNSLKHPLSHGLRRASSPKGAPFSYIGNCAATTEAVPLGKVAKPQVLTEGVIP